MATTHEAPGALEDCAASSASAIATFTADWPAPQGVRSLLTTRVGGFSRGPWAGFNLASHVGDDPAAVAANRQCLGAVLPSEPCWLEQVHGVEVLELSAAPAPGAVPPRADAAFTRVPGVVCAVLTADCLPLLLADDAGSVVAAAHAGWRGLCNGVIERTVAAMGCSPARLHAYLGPAIGATAFEVGDEVRAAFLAADPCAGEAFAPLVSGKWLADLAMLARQRLAALGVRSVSGGDLCTLSDAQRFYSYRRDGVCGRMASLVWLADA